MGAALLTRRKIIQELGLLDPKFYLWYEVVDFCRRVKSRGYEVKFFPGAVVAHAGAQSFSQLDIYDRKKILARSLFYYFRKNGSVGAASLVEMLMPRLINLLQKALKLKTRPHV